ncbi:MAG TPA: dUTP diphosphatase [Dongiaceae bacterium]|nr:dUTP diphosphatase [Dongiaceae bacterium]
MAEPAAVPVAVLRLPHGHDLPLPSYATADSAGMDLIAAVADAVALEPGDRALVPTGIAIALPQGFEAQVRPRSGLALKFGVTTLNTPGTIDADYRGEIGVILINHGRERVTIKRGDRIAQLVVAPVTRVQWEPREALDGTARGAGGFGSSGFGTHPDQSHRDRKHG